MNFRAVLSLFIVAALMACATVFVQAHSIDYLAASITPAATFNGSSGNFTVTDAVAGSSNIVFTVTFTVVPQGATSTFPRTVTFGANTSEAPGATVGFNNTPECTFTASGQSCSFQVTLTTPSAEGTYRVRIAPTSGTGGPQGLSSGGGITVNFTVLNPEPACEPVATQLTMQNACVAYRQSATNLSATLTTGGAAVANEEVSFAVDGTAAGSAITDADGMATLPFDPSALAAGDHAVVAEYAGKSCQLQPTSQSSNLGVTYTFVGFQQPINADGSSVFGGRAVPVKIRIADANAQPVTDATAHIYFGQVSSGVVGTDAEPLANTNADSGNQMRYDAAADQFVFNWDVTSLVNGTYAVRVDLGEGTCGDQRSVTLSLKRKGK